MSTNKTPNLHKTRSLGLRRKHKSNTTTIEELTPQPVALETAKSQSGTNSAVAHKFNTTIEEVTTQPDTLNKAKSQSATHYLETTPTNTKLPTYQSHSAPANFRPYRLSLSKRLCDSMTKKRLEFHMAQEKEKGEKLLDTEEVQINDTPTTIRGQCTETNIVPPEAKEYTEQSSDEAQEVQINILKETSATPTTIKKKNVEKVPLSPEATAKQTQARRKLIKQIEIVEEEMQAKQRHIAATQDVQNEIKRWRRGFNKSINEFQQNFEPYKEKFVLMREMGIDENLFSSGEDSL